jgi:predicted amidohydrolase YtcJ
LFYSVLAIDTIYRMPKTLFTNGTLFLPDGRFRRGALLVDGGVIAEVFVGGDGEEAPPSARIVDLRGRCLAPGFIDAHTHLMTLALGRLRCDLSGAASRGEVMKRLAEWCESADAGSDGPIVGVGWDQSSWVDPSLPTRDALDKVSGSRPVFARRICGHVGVVNGEFIKLLNGFDRFVDAETGLITEDAVFEATRLSYPSSEAIVPAVGAAMRELHALGVTGIHDVVSGHNLDAYIGGVASSRARIRIDAMFCVDVESYDAVAARTADLGDEWFRPLGVKLFADGSFGGRTAALNSSYSDAQTIGDFLLGEEALARTLRACAERGVVCGIHAVGDRALRTVLLETMRFPSDTDVFRIEHAELVGWDELRMLEKAPVYLAMQPNFVRNWQQPGGIYETRLGHDRWQKCNRFATLRGAGVPFVFSSDGIPPGPLFGMRGATHHPVEGERISLGDSISRYTSGPAPIGRSSRNAGELAAGHVADLVVLTGDPALGDPDLLSVAETYVAGERVFRRDEPRETGDPHGV